MHFYMAETVGFEPTCRFTGKTISSRSRYDHFDTSPSSSPIIIPDFSREVKPPWRKILRLFAAMIHKMFTNYTGKIHSYPVHYN